MNMQLAPVVLTKTSRKLLMICGKQDSVSGKTAEDGWKELAEKLGFPTYQRTPAEDAYRDGWHGVPLK